MTEKKDFDQIEQNGGIIKSISGNLYKKFLMGHVSNGSKGIINLQEGYALKVVALNNDFVKIVLLDYGKNQQMPKQTWVKSQKVTKKDIQKELQEQQKTIMKENDFEITEEVEY